MKEEEEEEEEEEYLPKELVARMDVSEDEPEKEDGWDSDSEDSDEENCEITEKSKSRYKPMHLLLTP